MPGKFQAQAVRCTTQVTKRTYDISSASNLSVSVSVSVEDIYAMQSMQRAQKPSAMQCDVVGR